MTNKYKVTNLGKFDLESESSGYNNVEVTVDSLGKIILNFNSFELQLDYDSIRNLEHVLKTVQRHIEDTIIDQAGKGFDQQKFEFMDDPSNW